MPTDWDAIRGELLEMARADLALRDDLARDGSLFQGYRPRMEALHQRHATRLAALIDAHGWPGRSRVGEEGARAAWLVLQHAIGNPPLMRRGLTLRLSPLPIEDAAGVDARRRAIGLGPLAQELRHRRGAGRRGRGRGRERERERPPADWGARQRDMERWLRQVGWRD